MWKKNTSVCNNTDKTFEELFNHFVLGLDEACIMTYACRNIKKKDLLTGGNTKRLSQISEFTHHLIHILYVHILILIHILSHTCASADFYCIFLFIF